MAQILGPLSITNKTLIYVLGLQVQYTLYVHISNQIWVAWGFGFILLSPLLSFSP